MARRPEHDILFEQVQVGPKTLRNRFWQVPHCNGAGSDKPGLHAEFRGMKAEGGWAAVFTEACSMAPESDILPWVISRIWDYGDVRNLSKMVDRVHDFGSLAGIELWHGGPLCGNPESRTGGVAVSQLTFPSNTSTMATGRTMTKREIRELRKDHVAAFHRARDAGFDLLTFYASIANFPVFFLYPFFNKRTDEYGGSFENRIRFTREVLEDVRSEIDDCAIGMRFAIDTLDEGYFGGYGDQGVRASGEGKDFIAALDHLVDYWDINLAAMNWGEDAGSSRFFESNHQKPYSSWAKKVSTKPVVNVGRFTDPDVMVEAIHSKQLDVIGAARPSISDPFLPKKIEEGRYDDIRECIGCNVCLSRYEASVGPIWCTQNATSGEEYRRGWHPERFSKAHNADNDVLIVGAGPAGMECARVLGERGMRRVHLVDDAPDLGGHLRWVTTMSGFGKWARVTDYRKIQLGKLRNIEHVPGTHLSSDEVLNYGAEYIVIATGSHWNRQGVTAATNAPIAGAESPSDYVLTPEDVVVANKAAGDRVVVFDSDGYFMGSALAELFARQGKQVTYVCDADSFAPYLRFTLEEERQYKTLISLGVEIVSQTLVTAIAPDRATLLHIWSDRETEIPCDTLVVATQRNSDCEIYDELYGDPDGLERLGVKGIFVIGDAHTPAMIAQSVFSGHRLAREIDSADPAVPLPFIRERRLVDSDEDDYTLGNPSILSTPPASLHS